MAPRMKKQEQEDASQEDASTGTRDRAWSRAKEIPARQGYEVARRLRLSSQEGQAADTRRTARTASNGLIHLRSGKIGSAVMLTQGLTVTP